MSVPSLVQLPIDAPQAYRDSEEYKALLAIYGGSERGALRKILGLFLNPDTERGKLLLPSTSMLDRLAETAPAELVSMLAQMFNDGLDVGQFARVGVKHLYIAAARLNKPELQRQLYDGLKAALPTIYNPQTEEEAALQLRARRWLQAFAPALLQVPLT